MVFCSECGTKHEDEAVFCENCGQKLEKPVLAKQEKEKKEKTFTKTFDSSKIKYLKYVGVFLAAVVVFSVARNFMLGYNDPGVKLMHGAVEALQESKPEFELRVTVEEADSSKRFLEGMTLEVGASVRKDEISAKAGIKNGKKDLAEAGISYQEGNLFIDLMDLYDDYLYMDMGPMEDNMTGVLALKDYLQDFKVKGVKWKTYGKIFTEEMGKNIDKDGSDVVLTLDLKDMSYAFDAMLDEAEDDKDLQEGLKEAIDDMLDDMIKDDFEFNGYDKRDFEGTKKLMDGNWDNLYNAFIQQMRNYSDLDYYQGLSDLEYTPLEDLDLRFTFSFGKLTGVETTIEEDGMKLKVDLNLKDGFNAKTYKVKKAEDLADFDRKDFEKVISKVIDQIGDNIKKDKDLVREIEKSAPMKALEWYGVEDFDDLQNYIEENLIYEFDMPRFNYNYDDGASTLLQP